MLRRGLQLQNDNYIDVGITKEISDVNIPAKCLVEGIQSLLVHFLAKTGTWRSCKTARRPLSISVHTDPLSCHQATGLHDICVSPDSQQSDQDHSDLYEGGKGRKKKEGNSDAHQSHFAYKWVSLLTNCEVDSRAYFVKKRLGGGIIMLLRYLTHWKFLDVFTILWTKPECVYKGLTLLTRTVTMGRRWETLIVPGSIQHSLLLNVLGVCSRIIVSFIHCVKLQYLGIRAIGRVHSHHQCLCRLMKTSFLTIFLYSLFPSSSFRLLADAKTNKQPKTWGLGGLGTWLNNMPQSHLPLRSLTCRVLLESVKEIKISVFATSKTLHSCTILPSLLI